MSLKVGYKQLDLTDCGAACLASVAAFYGLKYPLTRIREIAGTNSHGTNLLGMIEAAKILGIEAKAVKVNKDYIDSLPKPFIAHLNIQQKWFHFVVVYASNKNSMTIMDPANGKIQKIKKEKFKNEWTHIALLLEKGEKFKAKNLTKSNISRFFNLVKPFRSSFREALIAACIYSALGISTSIFVEKIIDDIIPSGSTTMLNILSLIFGLLLISRLFIGFSRNLLLLKTGLKIDNNLIKSYYRHVLKLPVKFFNTMRTGEIISRINDAIKIRAFINDLSLDIVVNILIVIITLSVMLSYSLKLCLVVILGIPIYYGIYILFNKLNKKNIRKNMEKNAMFESSLLESIKGIVAIKSSVKEDEYIQLLDKENTEFLNSGFQVNKTFSVAGMTIEFVSIIQLILLLWIGSKYAIESQLTIGELLSFYTLFGYLSTPLFKLILSNKSLQDALIAGDRLFQIMDLQQEIYIPEKIVSNSNFDFASIQLKNISFKFPGQTSILENINFDCHPGSITSITGESGCGKSTLLSLILRLNVYTKGNIIINGTDISTISLKQLRNLIGYIPQNPKLFSGTILENITMSRSSVNENKIQKIIHNANLSDKINSLSSGINTIVRENGENFSGGEKQKISIARTLYNNPQIMLFDEPAAAMDSLSEYELQNLLCKLKNTGKTIIVVSHRLNSTKISDNIVFIGNKSITESGSFEQLIAQKGDFYNLWMSHENKHNNLTVNNLNTSTPSFFK